MTAKMNRAWYDKHGDKFITRPAIYGHGRKGHTHCGNQLCCWGPAGKRDRVKDKPKEAR